MGVTGALALAVGAAGAALGASVGPLLRARIFYHSVATDTPWRRHCPACSTELIPSGLRGVVSALHPRGRCPRCGVRIGPPPGSVELLSGAVVAVLAARTVASTRISAWSVAALAAIFTLGVALALIDLAVHRLPDQLTLTGYAVVLLLLGAAVLAGADSSRFATAILCGLGVAGFYLVLILVYPAGMGLGDAKLALSLGTVLGWFGLLGAVFGAAAGFVLAGVASLGLLIAGLATAKTQIPHGPFMLLGAFAVVLIFL